LIEAPLRYHDSLVCVPFADGDVADRFRVERLEEKFRSTAGSTILVIRASLPRNLSLQVWWNDLLANPKRHRAPA
jgi:hypothetical protein